VKQESIPWQSFVFDAAWSSAIRNTSLGPFGRQAFLPVFFKGWAMAIFIFLTTLLQPKCAQKNVAKLALLGNSRGAGPDRSRRPKPVILSCLDSDQLFSAVGIVSHSSMQRLGTFGTFDRYRRMEH